MNVNASFIANNHGITGSIPFMPFLKYQYEKFNVSDCELHLTINDFNWDPMNDMGLCTNSSPFTLLNDGTSDSIINGKHVTDQEESDYWSLTE